MFFKSFQVTPGAAQTPSQRHSSDLLTPTDQALALRPLFRKETVQREDACSDTRELCSQGQQRARVPPSDSIFSLLRRSPETQQGPQVLLPLALFERDRWGELLRDPQHTDEPSGSPLHRAWWRRPQPTVVMLLGQSGGRLCASGNTEAAAVREVRTGGNHHQWSTGSSFEPGRRCWWRRPDLWHFKPPSSHVEVAR